MQDNEKSIFRVTLSDGRSKDYTEQEYRDAGVANWLKQYHSGNFNVYRLDATPIDSIADNQQYLVSIKDANGNNTSKLYSGSDFMKADVGGWLNTYHKDNYSIQRVRGYNDADLAVDEDRYAQQAREQRAAIEKHDADNKKFYSDHEYNTLLYNQGEGIQIDEQAYQQEEQRYRELKEERRKLQEEYSNNPLVKMSYKAEASYADQMATEYREKAEQSKQRSGFIDPEMVSLNYGRTRESANYDMARQLERSTAKLYSADTIGSEDNAFLGYVKQMGKGAANTFSEKAFWTRGMSNVPGFVEIRTALKRIEAKGLNLMTMTEKEFDENFRDDEKALISAYIRNVQAQADRAADLAEGYTAGQTAAESVGYMAEFLLTAGIGKAVGGAMEAGGAGFRSWITRELRKGSSDAIESYAKRRLIGQLDGKLMSAGARAAARDVVAAGTREGAGEAARVAAEQATKQLTKDLATRRGVAAAAKASAYPYTAVVRPIEKGIFHTALHPTTYSSIAESLATIDDNGELIEAGDAIWGTVLDQVIENWSESIGDAYVGVLDMPFTFAAMREAKGKALGKVTLGTWGKWLRDSQATRLVHQAGFHGLIGEMGEEWIGNAARVGLGIMDKDEFKEFASLHQQLEMAASFAPMTLFGLGTSTYATTKQAKDFRAAADAMRGVLNRQGMSEEEIQDVMDAKHSQKEIADALSPVLQSIVKSAYDGKTKYDDYVTTLKFAQVSAMNEVLASAQTLQREADRKEMRNEIGMELGAVDEQDKKGTFTMQVETGAVDKDGNPLTMEYVTTVGDADGNAWFLVGREGSQVALKGRGALAGELTFMDEAEYAAKIESGELKEETKLADKYLDEQVEAKRNAMLAKQRSTEFNDKFKELSAKLPIGSTINLGTEEAPTIGVVSGVTRDGVLVEFPKPVNLNGVLKPIHLISLEQAGNAVGVDAAVRDQEQMEADAVDLENISRARVRTYNNTFAGKTFTVDGKAYTYERMFEAPSLDESGTEMAKVAARDEDGNVVEIAVPLKDMQEQMLNAAEAQQAEASLEEAEAAAAQADDGILRDFRGNLIPMRRNEETGTDEVDKREFKRRDPEAYYRWNDSRRGGVTTDSQQALKADIAAESAVRDGYAKQLETETDPDTRDELEAKRVESENKINLYAGILHKYQAAENYKELEAEIGKKLYDVKKRMLAAKTQEQYDALEAQQVQLVSEYLTQTRDSARNAAYRTMAAEYQRELNAVADLPVVVTTARDIQQTLIDDGASQNTIDSVMRKVAEIERENILNGTNLVMDGLHNNGKVYIFVEGNPSVETAKVTYFHERQHDVNKHNPGVVDAVYDLHGGNREELMKTLGAIIGNTGAYTNSSERTLADEIVAFTMERAHTDSNYVETLKAMGLADELINIISNEYGRQTGTPANSALRSEDRDIRDGERDTASYRINERPGEAVSGEEQLGSVRHGVDAAEVELEQLTLPFDEELAVFNAPDADVTDVLSAASADEGVSFSIRTENTVLDAIRQFAASPDGKKMGWTPKQIEEIAQETTDLLNYIHANISGDPNYDAFAQKDPTIRVDWRDGKERQTVTWHRNNIEYKFDMSSGTYCINNEAIETILSSPVMIDLILHTVNFSEYNSGDYLTLYETLRDLGFVVPCKGCFDAAARIKMLPSVAQEFANLVNQTIDERNADPEAFDAAVKNMSGAKTESGFPAGAKNKLDAIRIGVAGDNLTEHISFTQLLSAEGQTKALADWGGIFRAWQRTGAGRPKDKLMAEPYTGVIMQKSSTIIAPYGETTPSFRDKEVNMGTGLRRNSHDEFRIETVIDEIQFIRDAWLKKLRVFKYMKELDDVRLFGKMGIKFNMSGFPGWLEGAPAAGLDNDGNYYMSEESVGGREFPYIGQDGRTHYDGMKGLQEAMRYINEDVSLSSVVMSMPHFIKALTDVPTPSDKSGLWGSLIPFHASGATADSLEKQGLGKVRGLQSGSFMAEAFEDYDKGVTNFEDVQNDRFGEGWTILLGKKAGTDVKTGHKIEFANGTVYRNDALGITLYASPTSYKSMGGPEDVISEVVLNKNGQPELDKDGNPSRRAIVNGHFYTLDSEDNKIAHELNIDYNDKVREIGTKYAYKEAADFYVNDLKKIGLIPRFDFEVPKAKFLEMCADARIDPHHPKLGWKGGSWSPADAESYYSVWCDYGMTDPATGELSPHRVVLEGKTSAEEFIAALPDNYIQIIKDGLSRYSSRRDYENSMVNDAIIEYVNREIAKRKMNPAVAKDILANHGIDNAEELVMARATEAAPYTREYDEQKIQQQAALDLLNGIRTFKEDGGDIRYSIRTKPAPKNTAIGYKVFFQKDGKLYPPMVANPGGLDTPMGVWLDADAAPQVATSKTGRKKVKAGGKGTQGGSGTLAYRPGWHLGEIPYALQFNRGPKVDNPQGIVGKNGKVLKVGKYFPKDFVWAEVEYANDVDYQDEAISYGYNKAGNFQHSLAGLPKVPVDGSYKYRTNANPATDPWIITGAMKVNRVLTDSEVDELVRQAGREPQLREGKTEEPRDVRENNEPSFRVVNNNQQVFVSNALASLDKIPMKSGNAQAWINKIQQAGGLKKEEDKWMGLTDWLKEQKGNISKEDVAEFIREHQVQIEDVKYEETREISNFEGLDFLTNEYKELLDMYSNEDDPVDYAQNEMEARHGRNFWIHFSVNGKGEIYVDQDSFYSYDEMSTTLRQYGVYPSQDVYPIDPMRLDYTTEGLFNKREIALVVPTVVPYNESDEIHFGDAGEGRAVAWSRFGDAVDADGNKVLVIDEIQSKRHQEGKEKGYDSVPDAPFRDSWDALAMKRMLRLAAEEGYDKVAWTSGQMQSDRYDLTKVLGDFYYKPNGDGTYKVSAVLNQKRPSYTDYSDLNYDSLTVDRIGEIFGKEIAAKVSEGKGRKGYSHNDERDWVTFSGRELKMANEGMRYFYDQKLVNWMNKYGKRWGVQVADLTLPDLENTDGWHSVDVTPEMKESVMEGQPMFRTVYHGSGADFDKFDMNFISTGEGAQAYGWGVYVTTNKDTGVYYANIARNNKDLGYAEHSLDELTRAEDYLKKYPTEEDFLKATDAFITDEERASSTEDELKEFDKYVAEQKKSYAENRKEAELIVNRPRDRRLYTVEIPDDNGENYLHWNETLTREQSRKIINGIIDRYGDKLKEDYGDDYKSELRSAFGTDVFGSQVEGSLNYLLGNEFDYATGVDHGAERNAKFLNSLGIVGMQIPIDYRGGQRYSGSNYVIYDVNNTRITDNVAFRAVELAGNPSLIAVHNLTENDLLNAFDLGGFPMPSIAITKADIGHTDFGDISLVFDKETINPKNRKNKVYSGDAWTPTFPTINYKLNEDKASDIATRARKVGDLPLFNPSHFDSVNYEGRIEDSDARSLIEEFKNDYNAKQFYLAEQGNPVREYEMHEVEKYTEENVRRFRALLDNIGLENLKSVDRNLTPEILQVVKGFLNAVGDLDDSRIKRIARNYVLNAIDYATKGNRTTEIDYGATHRKIDERIDQGAFEKWLEDLFSGIVEKRGIRNEVDMFTPIGNRRAWEKLYDEVTLDNVVKAMSKKPARGGSGFFGGNIFGASFKTYNSIADVREDAARRMAVVDSEELKKQKDDILNRLSNVKVTEKELGVGEMFDLTTNIKDAVAESHTAEGIHRYLKDFYPDITMEAAQEIADIVKDIQSISTKYFEAKPYRAVGFDEVKLAVVPEGTSQAIVDGLQERGVPVRTYEKDNQQERMDIISNATEEMGLRFRTVELTPETRGEMEKIKALARLNGTYLKAPNGADTKLTPEQWAMVRTKAFKDWFGDWESAAKRVDENIQFKDLIGKTIIGYRYGKAPEGGRSFNTLTRSYESGVSMASVGYNAEVGSFAATANEEEGKFYYIGEIAEETGGDDEICLNNVRELTKEEYESLLPQYTAISNAVANAYYNRSANIASRGYDIDLERAKAKRDAAIREIDSSKVVDENGEPRVMMHVTHVYGFNKFFAGNGEALYFTGDKSYAENFMNYLKADYERYVEPESFGTYEVFLNVRNPFDAHNNAIPAEVEDIYNRGELKETQVAIEEINYFGGSKILTSKGYDGAISDDMTVVVSPNQIKSATDNTGSFDPTDPDIRYRVTPAQDAEYQKAYEAGDVETARKMVDEVAKKAGYNYKGYHGSWDGLRDDDWKETPNVLSSKRSFYLSTDKKVADSHAKLGEESKPYYVRLNNPMIVDAKGAEYASINDPEGEYSDIEVSTDYLVSRYKARIQYDGLIIENVDEVGGLTTDIIPFRRDNSQVKSAEPFTFNDNGELIPLSQRFNPESNDIRYRVTPAQDAEYMSAVEAGDMDKAERMVRDAAMAAGYNLEAYHGTDVDFNEFKRRRHANGNIWGSGFYFADSEDAAAGWGERAKIANSSGDYKVLHTYLSVHNPLELYSDRLELGLGEYAEDVISKLDPEYDADIIDAIRTETPIDDYRGDANDRIADAIQELGFDAIQGYYYDEYHTMVFSPNQVKSADAVTYDDAGNVIPLSERFNSEDNDIRYRATEDSSEDAYEQEIAKDIENVINGNPLVAPEAESIKTETNADNEVLYRFIGIKGATRLDKELGENRIARLAETLKYYSPDSAENIKRVYGWELSRDDKGNMYWKYEEDDFGIDDIKVTDGAKLSDVVNDDNLFIAYPELKDYTLKLMNMNLREYGSINHNDKVIKINNYQGKKEKRRTLIHEIQHFIQDMEGWVNGTEMESEEIINAVDAIMPEFRQDLKDLVNTFAGMFIGRTSRRQFKEDRKDFGNKWGVKPLTFLVSTKQEDLMTYAGYMRKAGEVEARNAERRAGMTTEERRKSLAKKTQDVVTRFQWSTTPFLKRDKKEKATAEKAMAGLHQFDKGVVSDMLMKTYGDMPLETRKNVTDLAFRNGLKFGKAVVDYFSTLANRTDELNEYELESVYKMRDNLTKALGIESMSIYDALWTMVNTSLEGKDDLLSVAKRAASGHKLGRSVPMQAVRDKADEAIRFSIRDNMQSNSAADMYNKATGYWLNRLKEGYVDMNESVNDLVAAIEKVTGMNADSYEDVRLSMNQQSSKGLAAMKKYNSEYLEPMWDAIKEVMKVDKVSYDEVVRYVMLKHALERNEVFAKRDARAFYKSEYDKVVNPLKDERKKQERRRKNALANGDLTTAYDAESKINDIDTQVNAEEARLKRHYTMVDNGTAAKYKELREKDYGGLTSMYSDYPGLMPRKYYKTEEEYNQAAMRVRQPKYQTVAEMEDAARDEIKEQERYNDFVYDKLWDAINNATKQTLQMQYQSGILSKQQYEYVRDMFKYYVPMRGFKDTTAEDLWTYYNTQSSGSFAPTLVTASGRKTEAENPFNWIGTMASSAIAQGMKNETKLALYYFIANRPNQDLAKIGETWYEFDAQATAEYQANHPGSKKRIFSAAVPPYLPSANVRTVTDAYEMWEQDMVNKAKQGLAYRGKNSLDLSDDVAFIDSKQSPQHIIRLKLRGEPKTIIVNGNPRAAQAINGLLNVETSEIYDKFGSLLRWMSAVNTSYNPEFWISNMQRDLLFATMSMDIKGDGKRNFYRNLVGPWKIMKMMKDYENGSLGNSKTENYYREFAEEGAITGFTVVVGNEEWEKRIDQYINPSLWNKMENSGFMQFWQNLGEAVEQMTRFSAYVTARESGKGVTEAVNAAKEISVNFNRKGSGLMINWDDLDKLTTKDGKKLGKLGKTAVYLMGMFPPYARSCIMFFNAAVQGLNAMYKLVKKNKAKAAAWMGGYIVLGALQAVMHSLVDDDDDYLDMPDYTRHNNLLLGYGGVYFKWALPQEARAFYALGDMAVNHIMGRQPNKSFTSEALDALMEMLPVNPAAGVSGALPSIVQPLVEIVRNKDYRGARVYNDLKYLSESEKAETPRYTAALPKTSIVYINMAKLLNDISGGDEYDAGAVNLAPEWIQQVVEGLGGGLLTTFGKVQDVAVGAFNAASGLGDSGESLSVRRTPFLGRLLEINDERTRNAHVNELYYFYSDEAAHTKIKMSKMKKDQDIEALNDLLDSKEYSIYQVFKKYEPQIKMYNDQLKIETDMREKRILMQEQDEVKKQMIREISEIR